MGYRITGWLLLLLIATASDARGQQASPRMFPVYLNVEGEYVKSTTLLRLPYKAYAQPARSMAGLPLDEDEQLFLRFVESVRTKDLRGLQAILKEPAKVTPQAEGVIAAPRTVAQTLAMYNQSFNGFEDLRVEGRVPLDDGALFIWTAGTTKGRMVRGTVVTGTAGRRQVAEVTMSQPLETFIVNSLNRLSPQELPGLPSEPSGTATNQSLVLTKSGVELRFSGTRMNTTVPGAGTLAGPLTVLADRASACREKSVPRLLALHTVKSAAKLKQWFGTMNAEALDSHLAAEARPRDVRLVIDGGAVLLVFSTPKAADGSPGRDVRYDFVIRQADKYKIANVLYASFFDDLLRNTNAMATFLAQGPASPRK